MKLNPDALAECGDDELDSRDGVQEVTEDMILDYLLKAEELPLESAKPFAAWLDYNWYTWNENGENTVGQVINGALKHWRGYK
ncbi:hypothetical protein RGQ21_67280 [Kitasatospora aureofaciens]|nr:hypothetical protein RGQ21_67280 [Kitasatospora aureofaciens]